jgi:hypothetical protein
VENAKVKRKKTTKIAQETVSEEKKEMFHKEEKL